MSNYGTERMVELVELLANGELPHGTTLEQVRESARQTLAAYKHYHGGNPEKCDECGSRLKYQGWDNYETWELVLEIDNDQYMQETAYDIVREAGNIPTAADNLKAWIEDMVDEMLQVQGLKDGITNVPFYCLYRMDSVNWHEVARHFVDDEWYNGEDD